MVVLVFGASTPQFKNPVEKRRSEKGPQERTHRLNSPDKSAGFQYLVLFGK